MKKIDRVDLREVLNLVKSKLSRDVEAACGLFWPDTVTTTTYYAIGEEDCITDYAVGECDENP